jgi:hypothetical protein
MIEPTDIDVDNALNNFAPSSILLAGPTPQL